MQSLVDMLPLSWTVDELFGACVRLLVKSTPIDLESDNFLLLHNPGHRAIMKVQERCYSGTLIDTPMKIIDPLPYPL